MSICIDSLSVETNGLICTVSCDKYGESRYLANEKPFDDKLVV